MSLRFAALAAVALVLAGCSSMPRLGYWRGLGEPVGIARVGELVRGVGVNADARRIRDAGALPGQSTERYQPDSVRYVQDALILDTYQQAAGQVMLERSRNPHVRAFAERMMVRHQAQSARLVQVAQEVGLPVEPLPFDPGSTELIRQLRTANDVDAVYLAQQRGAQWRERQLHWQFQNLGEERPLRRQANRGRGLAERGIRQLDRLERRVLRPYV